MEAAASQENAHKVVLLGCASPPCSADRDLERFGLRKKEIIFFIQHISCTETLFLYCNYPIHSDADFAVERVMILEQRLWVGNLQICRFLN